MAAPPYRVENMRKIMRALISSMAHRVKIVAGFHNSAGLITTLESASYDVATDTSSLIFRVYPEQRAG